MFKLIGKLIKFVIILAVILGLLVGALYLGSEVFDLEFCDDIIDGLEDVFDDLFDHSSSASGNDSVLPGAKEFKPVEVYSYSNMPSTIEYANVDCDGAGYVVCVVCRWENCSGPIVMEVGIDREGTVRGARVLEFSDSDGKDPNEMANSFLGCTLDGLFERFEYEYVNGATDPYAAMAVGMMDALVCTEIIEGRYYSNEPEIAMDENEIYNLSSNLVGNYGLRKINVSAHDSEYLKRLYKVVGGNGYVAYLVVPSQDGVSETETLVHIGDDVRIVGIDKLVWNTGNVTSPSEDAVNEFYLKLIGAGTYELHYNFMNNNSELLQDAIDTSSNLVSSLYEALTFVDEIN